ncbi:cupin domain-containing protein (plasmid) [Deinococcus metallilatus]|uniref:Mannose-6-phosphate isomerase-like protein (Cupin superfamily) n=1 Tax=Deinococcus metallilatus TaxID=1211322 RepID=A0ABR6MQD4_9DEIO|nr:cupin domain-containing protein [Deinococcus metallilatus]MBB5293545.1 mannose-6-phosphate isomerase-like protein (cupin superfamily) [Deinococcus metallilatus]QBY06619.1 cupin domain-containing protein [Deinococcus metallilatus]RXJ17962.1 cupin domain-containing protein [Deinococcus metallilatus]GMA15234.1 hypothetical protein GCM10025871_15650 [Deinococcus metallilatus]
MTAEEHARKVGPEDGRVLVNPIGGRMVLKVPDAMTAGAYSVHDNILPPHSPGPRPHLHRDHEETFYVLAGELTVRVGDETLRAGAGTFVVIPRGVVHQPSNQTANETHVLLIFSPGGMDRFFVEAAEGHHPLQARPDDAGQQVRLRVFTERYGYEFVDFPGDG